MKGLLLAILALVAAPALAESDVAQVTKVDMSQFSGSITGRAASVIEADDIAQLAARQGVQRCRLPPSVFVGNPGNANPTNLDGTCISLNSCASVSGTEAFSGATGCASGVCCIKRDCAGAGTNSACLYPDLAGDTLQPGQAGAFLSEVDVRADRLIQDFLHSKEGK
ncbi:hypothetical protein K505DRAFT_335992 [Melanomma pulvis-pyrius CBS 109.77]|uniref:Uncharacterized protein n=1 Tax=Melanomma pulvis-pyrius CBS 109.77 TaxID=1314802 RepID=A0A6A6XHW3_9PLEO|nr:hypothetical protein K505DRAFT_335992 [Melanomma pulvis-pyrius CBS 109.77]